MKGFRARKRVNILIGKAVKRPIRKLRGYLERRSWPNSLKDTERRLKEAERTHMTFAASLKEATKYRWSDLRTMQRQEKKAADEVGYLRASLKGQLDVYKRNKKEK